MKLDLLYFSWVREAVGHDGEVVEVPGDVATVDDLLAWLAARGEGYAVFAETGRLRCAIDQTFAPLSTSIAGAREVAIFPPVTGG
ncbi:molybdopterin converting factor subunit 1 [Sphingomonas glacialis]|uniref:Molybdopterin synthase sulfur carrier subunit n=1 Tax=Sphingomonas glacialis TaxID=658225 RepID=A0A502G0Y7_9SPHN|nr:molybdopterin converting factor subunit 1 [Sphingomonas glacialis]TPG55291.1 molybdopterin converting factor subunit 1 [Sphingomonas glacialis]